MKAPHDVLKSKGLRLWLANLLLNWSRKLEPNLEITYRMKKSVAGNPFKVAAAILHDDELEAQKIELRSTDRKVFTHKKIDRALQLYRVRHPSATIQEFNNLSVSKRRELITHATFGEDFNIQNEA